MTHPFRSLGRLLAALAAAGLAAALVAAAFAAAAFAAALAAAAFFGFPRVMPFSSCGVDAPFLFKPSTRVGAVLAAIVS